MYIFGENFVKKQVLSLLALSTISASIMAATVIAPTNRIALFQITTPYAYITDSNYTVGTTSAMGTISTLQSNATVISALRGLDYGLYPGRYNETTSFNGSLHQAITENYNSGHLKQCVHFARAMTSTPYQTGNWYPGSAISSHLTQAGTGLYILSWYGQTYPLQPGTMLAYFGGQSRYDYNSKPHVTIFLSWKYSGSYIVGMNVVDQNLVDSISINGVVKYAAGITGETNGMIQKHALPIACTAGTLCTSDARYKDPRFWSRNYHVVDAH